MSEETPYLDELICSACGARVAIVQYDRDILPTACWRCGLSLLEMPKVLAMVEKYYVVAWQTRTNAPEPFTVYGLLERRPDPAVCRLVRLE